MSAITLASIGVLLLVLVTVLALVLAARAHRGAMARLAAELCDAPARGQFDAAMVASLPEPAQRYFRHAIAEGTPLSPWVSFDQSGRMKLQPGRPHVELRCVEALRPERGFVWDARGALGGLPFRALDHYDARTGAVRVFLLGIFPVVRATDADVARSSRGRLVAEAVWCPAALLPRPGVRWEPVDGKRARVMQTVDGEELAMTLRVGPEGELLELSMERHGDVRGDDWGPTPYGFEVLAERTFAGHTIPSHLRGGWHFGTPEYEEEDASEFIIRAARFAGGDGNQRPTVQTRSPVDGSNARNPVHQ